MARQYIASDNIQNEDVNEKLGKQIKIGICIGLLVIGAGTIGLSAYQASITNNESSKLKKELQVKTQELANLKSQDGVDNVEEVNVKLSSAKEMGEKLCDIQNQLNAMFLKGVDASSEQYQTPLKELKAYVGSDDNNDTLSTGGWYRYGTWYFESTYDYVGNNVPCIWTCYKPEDNAKKQLLACVTGVYDSINKVFTDMSVEYTSYGANNIPSDTDGGAKMTTKKAKNSKKGKKKK